MNVLHRILFYMQKLPIPLPRSFFTQLSNMFSSFIWNSQKPRIALKVLKHSSGLGIPDIRYHQAIVLQRILNCCFHAQSKLWVSMEKYMAGRNLSFAPWLSREHRGLSDNTSLLTTHTLKTWHQVNWMLDLAPSVSPQAPLGGFLWFSRGNTWLSLDLGWMTGMLAVGNY